MVGFSQFDTPQGNLVPQIRGTSFNAPFTSDVTFTAGSHQTCGPGEYRQSVKGKYVVNGSTLTHFLCAETDTKLLENVFQEDGCPSGTCTAYGHRSCPQDQLDTYKPDRATGCRFWMWDAPSFDHIHQGSYTMDLVFMATLIDTSNSNQILATRTWSVHGNTTVPAGADHEKRVGLSPTDRIIAAYRKRNVETGALEVHIVIARPPGRPPLDPTAVRTTFVEDSGQRSTASPEPPPLVDEVRGRARSTASIVYTLPRGVSVPAKVEMAVNGGLVTMNVQVEDALTTVTGIRVSDPKAKKLVATAPSGEYLSSPGHDRQLLVNGLRLEPGQQQLVEKKLYAVAGTGLPAQLNFEYRHKSGNDVWVFEQAIP
jgi:hypothetical protein